MEFLATVNASIMMQTPLYDDHPSSLNTFANVETYQ